MAPRNKSTETNAPKPRTRKIKASLDEAIPPVVARTLPPGGGTSVVPPVQQFVGIYSSGRKFFKNGDEAYLTNREDAWRMWFDLSIQEPLQSRILAVAQLPWHLEPEDKKDAVQLERAKEIQRIIEDIPGFLKMKVALQHAIWFGKYGTQQEYEWRFNKQGRKVLAVKNWSPVHGDSLVYKFDSDAVGVLVGPNSYPGDGTKYLTTEPTELGLAHVLSPWEREAFCIHTHLHLSNDYLKVMKAGQTKGVGLRDTVFWTWYLKQECMGLLQEYMERVGLGITIFRYEASNEESLKAVQRLAESQTSNMQIFWPYTPDEKSLGGAGIERIEPSSVGMENFMRIIDQYFGSQIKRYIVGQDLTSESKATGLGSNLASVHENTFMRLVKLDATNLQETLTDQLVRVIHKYSYPEDDFRLRFRIAVDRPDPKEYLDGAKAFYDMGGSLDEDEVRSVLGFTRPDSDSAVLRKQPEGAGLPGTTPDGTITGDTGAAGTGPDATITGDSTGGGTEGPVSDDEAADEIGSLLHEVYSALGVEDVQIDRDALLEKVRGLAQGEQAVEQPGDEKLDASRTGDRKKYRLSSPPWPGAVFDEGKHRWVTGTKKDGGGQGAVGGGTSGDSGQPDVPSDQDVWQEVAPALAEEHPEEMAEPETAERVQGLVGKLKEKVYSFMYRINPYLLPVVEAVIDTPSDFVQFGYQPSVSGTAAPNTDPFKAATGISTHLAISLASKVLAAGLVWARGKLKGEKVKASRVGRRLVAEMLSA